MILDLKKGWKNHHFEKPAHGQIIYTIGPNGNEILGRYYDRVWFVSFDENGPKGYYPKHWYLAPPEIAAQYNDQNINTTEHDVSSRTGKPKRQYKKRAESSDK